MASDNGYVLNEFHLRTNNILSSNSVEAEGDLPCGKMSSILMERSGVFSTKG